MAAHYRCQMDVLVEDGLVPVHPTPVTFKRPWRVKEWSGAFVIWFLLEKTGLRLRGVRLNEAHHRIACHRQAEMAETRKHINVALAELHKTIKTLG